MTYQTTVTQKGQITIPKTIRDALSLARSQRVFIELEKNGTSAKITPAFDFLEVANKIQVTKPTDPLKARESLESAYERL